MMMIIDRRSGELFFYFKFDDPLAQSDCLTDSNGYGCTIMSKFIIAMET